MYTFHLYSKTNRLAIISIRSQWCESKHLDGLDFKKKKKMKHDFFEKKNNKLHTKHTFFTLRKTVSQVADKNGKVYIKWSVVSGTPT